MDEELLCLTCGLPTAWHGAGDNLWCPVGKKEKN